MKFVIDESDLIVASLTADLDGDLNLVLNNIPVLRISAYSKSVMRYYLTEHDVSNLPGLEFDQVRSSYLISLKDEVL